MFVQRRFEGHVCAPQQLCGANLTAARPLASDGGSTSCAPADGAWGSTTEAAAEESPAPGEAEAASSEIDMARVATSTTSWADEVEEEIMAAEDAKPGSWAAVAAAPPPKPTGRSTRIYTGNVYCVLFERQLSVTSRTYSATRL